MKHHWKPFVILAMSAGMLIAQEQPDTGDASPAAVPGPSAPGQGDAAIQDEATDDATEVATKANPEEAAIRKAIDSYVEAFNKADAKALAAHWGEQGEFTTPAGLRTSQTVRLPGTACRRASR